LNDLRSFLRYLGPGIAFGLEIALFWVLAGLDTKWVGAALEKSALTAAVGAIFASGGLGYLLGQAHHVMFWGIPGYAAYDLVPPFSRLQNQKRITFRCQTCGDVLNGYVPRHRESWQLVTAIWYGLIKDSKAIEGSTPRADSLTDLMHSSGSAFVGCCLASVLAVSFAYASGACPSQQLFLAIALLVVLHFLSYRTLGNHAQGFVENVLFNSLPSDGNTLEYFVRCAPCKVAQPSVPSDVSAAAARQPGRG
jgi:hypothetical protein